MEHTLSFKLLGTPTIKVDGNIKIFSFSKINALLYYMVINKQISRDEIAGILWPSKDEKSAKKKYNLSSKSLVGRGIYCFTE